ncbi:MAG: metal-dependent hydrolase [Alcanivorax sp.]|jgi:predicted metal-dependent hydrolase
MTAEISMQNPEIKPRHMSMPFENIDTPYFFNDNALLSAFFSALSSTFPAGEGEFIASVRLYRDKVQSDKLKDEIRGFIGQEGHHSRQHQRANEILRDLGFDAVKLDKDLEGYIKRHVENRSDKFRLGMTVCMEHLTAILAEHLLTYPETLESLAEPVQDLLYWHAVEEIEHKSVAFDTFMSIEGDQKYLRWCQVYATLFFFHRIGWYTIKLLWWQKKMPSWKDFKGFWRFMTGKKGMFTGVQKNYFDWFKVGFHPWDHDNADLIERWKTEFYREDQDIGAQKAKAKAEASAA